MNHAELSAEALQELCEQFKAVVQRDTGKPFPQKPREQLRGAIEAVFAIAPPSRIFGSRRSATSLTVTRTEIAMQRSPAEP